MNFKPEIKNELKKIIEKAISNNNGRFDRSLKLKLKEIILRKLRQYEEEQYIMTTYSEISNQQKNKVLSDLHINDNSVDSKVNEDVIGGFIIKSNSKMIDASINGYINNLTRNLAE